MSNPQKNKGFWDLHVRKGTSLFSLTQIGWLMVNHCIDGDIYLFQSSDLCSILSHGRTFRRQLRLRVQIDAQPRGVADWWDSGESRATPVKLVAELPRAARTRGFRRVPGGTKRRKAVTWPLMEKMEAASSRGSAGPTWMARPTDSGSYGQRQG